MIAFQQNKFEKARDLFEQRLVLARKNGFRQSAAYAIFLLGTVAWKLGDPAEVHKQMLEALAHFQPLGNYTMLNDCLLGLAWANAELGNLERAAYLFGAIEKAGEPFRIPGTFEDVSFHIPIMESLRTRLDSETYKAERQRGNNSSLDEVTKEMLET